MKLFTMQLLMVQPKVVERFAKAGSDYTDTSGSHEFVLNGDKTHTVSVPISEDELYELDESFTMTLSGNDASSSVILTDSAVGTIENDDPFLPSEIAVVAMNDGYVTEGNAVAFEFTADPELAEDLEVNISHIQVGNFLMDSPGSTITIPANTSFTTKHMESFNTKPANGNVEADGSVTLNIEIDTYDPNVQGDKIRYSVDGTNGEASVRIEDANTPSGVSIIALSSEVTEGASAQFEIKADATSSEAREVNINVDDGTADFLASADIGERSITIPANNRTFMLDVPITQDSTPEQHGVIKVSIAAPSAGASFAYSIASTYNSATVNVFDDDAPTGISIAAVPMSVTEAPNTYAEFQVIADTIDNNNRTIEVRVENDSGDDFIDADQDASYSYDPADDIFDVTIPAGARFGLLRVKIHDDSKHEDDGQIMATIVTTPAVSPNNTATIMIENDDKEVPIVSISSTAETTGVTEGYEFTFEVESDRKIVGSPLEVTFNLTAGSTGATLTETTIRLTSIQQSAIGTVTLPNADVSSTGANIIIEVLEAVEYDVSASDPSITVPVKDNDTPSTSKPRMSITSANYVADGEAIELTVTASNLPNSSTDIKVMLGGDVSFLDDGQAQIIDDITLDGVQVKTFEVDTKANSASSNHGIITATILEGADYVRPNTAAENETSFVVVDDLPVISIAEIADVDKSAGTFTITLTSDSPALASYPINITTLTVDDTNSTGPQYYDSHAPTEVVITDSSTGDAERVTVTLTKDDSIYQGWGDILVSVADGADYTADTNANSRNVTIIDDQTAPVTVSVSARGSAVEDTTLEVTFTATGTFPAGGSIEVVPTISETGSITGYYGSHTPQMVTLSAGNTSDTINITLPDNYFTQDNGELTISIKRGDGYEVHTTDHTKVVMLLDEESIPKVSVIAVSSNIDEGEVAVFELAATGAQSQPLNVFVNVDDGAGEFLTNIHTNESTEIVTNDDTRHAYPTTADADTEPDGTITLTILDDHRDIIEYLVDTAPNKTSTATVSVLDNDDPSLPSVTIAGDQASIIEGEMATFTLTVTDPVPASLSVLVEVVETNDGNGDFFNESSDQLIPDRIGIDQITKTGTIELASIRDADTEDDGLISVRIKSDDSATTTYSVGTAHRASIIVMDDDDSTLPNLTIALKDPTKKSIMEGDPDPIFTITSTGGTDGATLEFDLKVLGTGNFLNTAASVRTLSLTIGTPFDHTEVINNDDVDEPDGTITATLLLKNPSTYGIGAEHQVSLDISDDEATPEFTITAANPSIEEGTDTDETKYKTYDFNVNLNRQSMSDITVEFEIGAEGDTAFAGADKDYTHVYDTPEKRILTFTGATTSSPGQTSKTITVTIIADALNEADETFTVTLSNPTNAGFAGSEPTISEPGEITNDDAVPNITLDSATAETTEGSAISFPVTLSAASGRDITIAYTLTDGTATTTDSDYTNPAEADRTLTIPAGDTTGTITIDTGDDSSNEADEVFTITLDEPSDVNIVTLGAISEATGTILSNDAPTLSIESKSINENVETVTLKVRLANPGGTAISVPWHTVAGTAHETSDYTVASGMLEFDGTNADKEEEIAITIIDDPRDEDNQNFTVQLGDVANVTRLGGGTGTVTIEDDDAEPTVTIADITPQPEDDGANPANDAVYNIDVTLSHASEKAVSVDFTVTADTAVATHDYVLTNSRTTLTFDNESTNKQITLNLKADNIDENDETFNVQLTSATNAEFAPDANTPKTVTINDNDDPPVISIDNVNLTEGSETGGTFTITQTPNSGKTVEVTATYADVSATEGASEDYQITTTGFDETTKTRTFVFDPANEPAAMATMPLTFTINDDLLNEAVETFTVTLSNPTSSPDFTFDTTNNTHIGTVTINDNDAVPSITLDSATAENTEGSAISFPVTLSAASGRDITIAYTLTDGTATTADSDYTNPAEADRTLTIPAGDTTGTITVDTGMIQVMKLMKPSPLH